MRAVVQRASRARVLVSGREIGAITKGLVVLVGVAVDDGAKEPDWLVDKLLNLRIFSDEDGKMNRSLLDVQGEALVISQFTLYGDTRKGRRPSFVRAAAGAEAEALYNAVVTGLEDAGIKTATGEFGARMQVELTNDGPVTLVLDSKKAF
jgi:D-aminoacyl-tRNA deacylase